MILGFHVILSTYGFWLPNDPRGSWSDFVGSRRLLAFGPATRVWTRQSVAGRSHDHRTRLAAKTVLKQPPLSLTGRQARAVGRGFARAIARTGLAVWACAILPRHVHLVVGRHRLSVEQIVNRLKGEATRQLIEENLHPEGRSGGSGRRGGALWARGHWRVFLNAGEDILRAVRYVEDNPSREGKPPQRWPFVRPFSGQV